MRKLIAFSLVIALAFVVLAPLSAFAGGRHGGNHGGYQGHRGHSRGISSGAAVGIGLGSLALGVLIGQAIQPQPVYVQAYPQPVYVSPMYPMYRSPVCVGQLTTEYGWRQHPSGNGVEYVPTGRTFCNGQILY
ncbi:MAG: hypothetical protein WAP51_01860 [Candidatus Sungiibacteriota bacterium]